MFNPPVHEFTDIGLANARPGAYDVDIKDGEIAFTYRPSVESAPADAMV